MRYIPALLCCTMLVACVRFDAKVLSNEAPIAVAPDSLHAFVNDTVVLDGRESYDPDDDSLSYLWEQVGSEGQPVTLVDHDTAVASFTAPDTPQRLFFRLLVDDGATHSAPAVVQVDVVEAPNTRPVAVVPTALYVSTGDTVLLDGSESYDDDGDALTFVWTQVEGSGDPITLSDANSAVASFNAPDIGQRLFFRLVVSDGKLSSEAAVVRVNVNAAPVAEVPAYRQTFNQTPILIEGSGIDPDGDLITSYHWRVSSGPPQASTCLESPSPCLSGADSPAVVFTPPSRGSFILSLVVSDGMLESLPANVHVESLSRKPVAVATADATVVANGSDVNLDATGSFADVGETIVSYQWSVISTPPGGIASFNPVTANVADPALTMFGKGTYFVELTVTDSAGSPSDPVSLRLDTTNNRPEGFPGTHRSVTNGNPISIEGMGVDIDGDPLTFTWSLTDSPPNGAVSLQNANTPTVTFTPNRRTLAAGDDPINCGPGLCYQLTLVVSDGIVLSEPKSIYVVSLNRPPVANAGPISEAVGTMMYLDGTASYDPDGDAMVWYRWTQRPGDPDALGGAEYLDGPVLQVPAPQVGVYEFRLTVFDGTDVSAPDSVFINVGEVNNPPHWTTPPCPESMAVEGTLFPNLDCGVAVDPDGDELTIFWTRRAGSPSIFPASFSGEAPNITAPSFKALLEAGQTYADYDVVASDGMFSSAPETVRLYVQPGAGFVVVAPDGTNSEECGSATQPCGSLLYALSLINGGIGVSAGDIGDGRHVVMTSGHWDVEISGGVVWPGGTSLFGGRDSVTFARSVPSDYQHTRTHCSTPSSILYLPSIVGAGVIIDNMDFALQHGGCGGTETRSVFCENCRAHFRETRVRLLNTKTHCAGVRIAGTGADPLLERVTVEIGACSLTNYGVHLLTGAQATLIDSNIRVSGASGATHNAAVALSASDIEIRRSLLTTWGNVPAEPTLLAALSVTNGGAYVENTVLRNLTPHGGGNGVYLSGSSVSLINNTILGAYLDGPGVGVFTDDTPISLMNNIVAGFGVGMVLGEESSSPLASHIYGNAWHWSGDALAACNGDPTTEVNNLNAAAGSGCNQSAFDWSGNIAATCPLVNPTTGDFRLNAGTSNPCLNAGLLAAAAGVAPPEDRGGLVRPDPISGLVDIGAHEAQ